MQLHAMHALLADRLVVSCMNFDVGWGSLVTAECQGSPRVSAQVHGL
jgi:hypothetical protein